jgi:hypothetical protein
MPEDTQFPIVFPAVLQSLKSVIDPQILMVLGYQLDESCCHF